MIDAIVRANPSYDLLLLDSLSSAERQFVGDTDQRVEVYGYLRPHVGSGLQWRSVSPDVALLLLTLATPGRVPAYLRARLGGTTSVTVQRLVLDGVLEIERDGKFVSGSRSIDTTNSDRREAGKISQQSVAALQYAQTLEGLAVEELAMRLYCYGRRPLSPSWQSRLANDDAIEEFLGLNPNGAVRNVLNAEWTEARTGGIRFWRMWVPRDIKDDTDAAVYKLYVSPGCDALPAALQATAETLSGVRGVLGFKVGRDLSGLSRPDKLVAYFSRMDTLQLTAAHLRRVLQGSSPHGVPFTAEITRDGLLSWGIDPPEAQRMLEGGSEGSWRVWIVNRLADYLIAAQGQSVGENCWQFALNRLRLEGLDTDTWVPTSRLWAESTATGCRAY